MNPTNNLTPADDAEYTDALDSALKEASLRAFDGTSYADLVLDNAPYWSVASLKMPGLALPEHKVI